MFARRVEPDVPSATHAGLVTPLSCRGQVTDFGTSGRNLPPHSGDAPYVHCARLATYMWAIQVSRSEPFRKATKVLVDESRLARKRLSVLN